MPPVRGMASCPILGALANETPSKVTPTTSMSGCLMRGVAILGPTPLMIRQGQSTLYMTKSKMMLTLTMTPLLLPIVLETSCVHASRVLNVTRRFVRLQTISRFVQSSVVVTCHAQTVGSARKLPVARILFTPVSTHSRLFVSHVEMIPNACLRGAQVASVIFASTMVQKAASVAVSAI